MEKIEALWKLIIEYGTHIRLNGLDGLNSWNALKQILESNKINFTWSQDAINRFDEMLKMGVIEDEKLIPHEIWELHHFYLQHTRIPYKNKNDATFVRLFQIAYNAGQLYAEMNIKKNPIYTEEWKKYYIVNNLNSPQEYTSERDLHYINSSIGELLIVNIKTLLDSIKNQQVGGKYFKKYLQMKSKREKLETLIRDI